MLLLQGCIKLIKIVKVKDKFKYKTLYSSKNPEGEKCISLHWSGLETFKLKQSIPISYIESKHIQDE